MLTRLFLLLVAALVGCGRDPLGVPDGAPLNRRSSDPGAQLADGSAGQAKADACVPLTCRDPGCFPAYCGVIGNGCGGALDCGACAVGWSCKNGQCFPDDCPPISCDTPTPYRYCGTIGDGCGRSLDCTCPSAAWTCVDRVCTALSGCARIPGCVAPSGHEYCGGFIGDGCGGVLDCRRECSQAGFVCRNNLCVASSDAGPTSGAQSPPPVPPPPPIPPAAPPPPCPSPPLAPIN